MPPYIIYGKEGQPVGGADVKMLEIVAAKLGFGYHLKPETIIFDQNKPGGTLKNANVN